MTKRKISQDNLHLILPGKISRMATIYATDQNIPVTEAIKRIYQSETYRELEKEDSKLWHYGPVALYQIFLEKH
ncbi:MAG: hypothetical protein K2M98_07270 [Muribaculum sp.]|nr:hypothetical protein [Muribaculum sp.]